MFTRHLLPVAMALSIIATSAIPAQAYRKSGSSDQGLLPQTSYMAESGRISAPYGHIEFCIHSPSECLIRSASVKTARLNASNWRLLKQINYKVNRSMRAKSDRAAHGITDHWSVGGRVGDCEDYALTKRRELIRRGWSSSTLLVATARDLRNRMHAVLIAHTSRGDFVLDNLTGRIRAWNKTGYKWLKRQSRQNPKKWVRLTGRPVYTSSIPGKSSQTSSKHNKAHKASALAILRQIRALKKVSSQTHKSRPSAKTKPLAALPPLPARNGIRSADARINKLLKRLENVQKRLIIRKAVNPLKTAKKTVQKYKQVKKASRKRSASKALAALRKIRKARRNKSKRTDRRGWTYRSFGGSFYSI